MSKPESAAASKTSGNYDRGKTSFQVKAAKQTTAGVRQPAIVPIHYVSAQSTGSVTAPSIVPINYTATHVHEAASRSVTVADGSEGSMSVLSLPPRLLDDLQNQTPPKLPKDFKFPTVEARAQLKRWLQHLMSKSNFRRENALGRAVRCVHCCSTTNSQDIQRKQKRTPCQRLTTDDIFELLENQKGECSSCFKRLHLGSVKDDGSPDPNVLRCVCVERNACRTRDNLLGLLCGGCTAMYENCYSDVRIFEWYRRRILAAKVVCACYFPDLANVRVVNSKAMGGVQGFTRQFLRQRGFVVYPLPQHLQRQNTGVQIECNSNNPEEYASDPKYVMFYVPLDPRASSRGKSLSYVVRASPSADRAAPTPSNYLLTTTLLAAMEQRFGYSAFIVWLLRRLNSRHPLTFIAPTAHNIRCCLQSAPIAANSNSAHVDQSNNADVKDDGAVEPQPFEPSNEEKTELTEMRNILYRLRQHRTRAKELDETTVLALTARREEINDIWQRKLLFAFETNVDVREGLTAYNLGVHKRTRSGKIKKLTQAAVTKHLPRLLVQHFGSPAAAAEEEAKHLSASASMSMMSMSNGTVAAAATAIARKLFTPEVCGRTPCTKELVLVYRELPLRFGSNDLF